MSGQNSLYARSARGFSTNAVRVCRLDWLCGRFVRRGAREGSQGVRLFTTTKDPTWKTPTKTNVFYKGTTHQRTVNSLYLSFKVLPLLRLQDQVRKQLRRSSGFPRGASDLPPAAQHRQSPPKRYRNVPLRVRCRALSRSSATAQAAQLRQTLASQQRHTILSASIGRAVPCLCLCASSTSSTHGSAV